MEKVYEYFITEKIWKLLNRRIKLKSHLIEILIEVCSLLLANVKPEDSSFGSFRIHINKMGRIFFSLKDGETEYKHFSFNFPFNIQNRENVLELYSLVNRIKIESEYLAILRTISAAGGFDETESIYGILINFSQLVEESIHGLGLSVSMYEHDIDRIVLELFTFEPGYIRYDRDEAHENGELHPLHHLDVFYSQRNTFKLGFRNPLTVAAFRDLLDITSNCKYISD